MEAPAPKITYEDLKDVLRNDGKTEKDGVLSFETATFQQIVAHNEKLVCSTPYVLLFIQKN